MGKKTSKKDDEEKKVTIVCDACQAPFEVVMNKLRRCPKCGVRVRAELCVVVRYGG